MYITRETRCSCLSFDFRPEGSVSYQQEMNLRSPPQNLTGNLYQESVILWRNESAHVSQYWRFDWNSQFCANFFSRNRLLKQCQVDPVVKDSKPGIGLPL